MTSPEAPIVNFDHHDKAFKTVSYALCLVDERRLVKTAPQDGHASTAMQNRTVSE